MKRIYRKILRELHPDELSLLRRDQECFTVGPPWSWPADRSSSGTSAMLKAPLTGKGRKA
jgi:hypothetical protein